MQNRFGKLCSCIKKNTKRYLFQKIHKFVQLGWTNIWLQFSFKTDLIGSKPTPPVVPVYNIRAKFACLKLSVLGPWLADKSCEKMLLHWPGKSFLLRFWVLLFPQKSRWEHNYIMLAIQNMGVRYLFPILSLF